MAQEQRRRYQQQNTANRYMTVGNHALKPDYYGTAVPKPRPQQRPQVQPKPQAKPQAKPVSVFKGILTMGLVAGMLVMMISRYAAISQVKAANQEMAAQITQLEDEARHLTLSLSQQTDMNMQKVAQEELNMGFPAAGQVLTVPMEPTAEIAEAKPVSNWFDSLLDRFNAFERRLHQ